MYFNITYSREKVMEANIKTEDDQKDLWLNDDALIPINDLADEKDHLSLQKYKWNLQKR